MQLTTYDKYKDSGIEWLGSVPEHWSVNRLKSFCTKITDGAHTSPDLSSSDFYFLSVVNLKNGVLNFKNALKTSKIDYEKLVRNGCRPAKGDVLFSKDGTIGETVEIKESIEFVVGSSFIILRPISKQINSTFFRYLLSSDANKMQARLFVRGAGLPRISIFNTAKLFCSVPPLKEQTTIANYLDQQTSRIDKKINLLTQKIKHYQDLKTALINKVVTKGLDDTVEMKDSGVEWIGEIPKHWEANALKRFYSNIGSGTTPTSGNSFYYENGTINWVVTGDLNNGILKNSKYKITEQAFEDYSTLKIYPKGTLLIAMYGATIGKTAILDFDACTNQACCALAQGKKVNNKFMFYWFLAQKKHIINLSVGGGQPNISQGIIKEIIITVPPKAEQQKIVNYLNQKTSTIDKIITNLQNQIEQQKDFRKTLINDIVTGKLKVSLD